MQVLAQAITRGCDTPVDDYLKMTNRKKVIIRDIDPKAVSTQDLYGFVNMATREWKVSRLRHRCRLSRIAGGILAWLCANAAHQTPYVSCAGRPAVLHHA